MIIPQVHWYGTSRDELVRQLSDAQEAIVAAVLAMGRATPHGRDYYVIGDQAITQARAEHQARLDKLHSILGDLQQITEGVLVQEARG